jgi:hypothetical protein
VQQGFVASQHMRNASDMADALPLPLLLTGFAAGIVDRAELDVGGRQCAPALRAAGGFECAGSCAGADALVAPPSLPDDTALSWPLSPWISRRAWRFGAQVVGGLQAAHQASL